MVAPLPADVPVADRIHAELLQIRLNVAGVHGSLVATSDGFLVSHDVPDIEPTQIAALVATTRALASRTTAATGRGQFREALSRGTDGYFAVYAAGPAAILAVIGSSDLNVGMLQYQIREIIERISVFSGELESWTNDGSLSQPPPAQPQRPAAPRTHAQPARAQAPSGRTIPPPSAGPATLPRRRASS